MNPWKHTMSALARIASWVLDKIIKNLAKEHKIQTRSFNATSHDISMVYAHPTHALSLNDICDGLPVELLPAEQYYRMQRYSLGTEVESHQGEP